MWHDILWHVDHMPARRLFRGKGCARVVKNTDTVLILAKIFVKHVDIVSERTSLGIGHWITKMRQLFPSVLDKRVSKRFLIFKKEDELIFEIGQTTLEGIGAFLWSFDCETSLRAINLEDPKVGVIRLEQTRLPDLAAEPFPIWEVFFFFFVLKPLALTCLFDCYYGP